MPVNETEITLSFIWLDIMIKDNANTAPGKAYPIEENMFNVFEALVLYSLSTNKI